MNLVTTQHFFYWCCNTGNVDGGIESLPNESPNGFILMSTNKALIPLYPTMSTRNLIYYHKTTFVFIHTKQTHPKHAYRKRQNAFNAVWTNIHKIHIFENLNRFQLLLLILRKFTAACQCQDREIWEFVLSKPKYFVVTMVIMMCAHNVEGKKPNAFHA